MNWKERLSEIEKDFGFHKERNWKSAIDLVSGLLAEYPSDVELNIRAIYILHNILVEEEYPDEEQNRMIDLLQKWFNQSKEKFSEDTEYLFFIGKILHIAEWYFGINEGMNPVEKTLAFQMQKKAYEMEKGNVLYEWAYRFSLEDKLAAYLAEQILLHDKATLKWLKSKGFPGEYILATLEQSRE